MKHLSIAAAPLTVATARTPTPLQKTKAQATAAQLMAADAKKEGKCDKAE